MELFELKIIMLLKTFSYKRFIEAFAFLLLINISVLPQQQKEKYQLKVGSKKFTESVILGEIATQLARLRNSKIIHLREFGGTRILWSALLKGDIDIYPEYTGTSWLSSSSL